MWIPERRAEAPKVNCRAKGEIVLRIMTRSALIVGAAAILTSCATTSLQSTWKNPAAARLDLKGRKVAAVVLIDEQALRYAAEDALAGEITAHGGVGIPAYTLVPKEQIRDKDKAREVFASAGVEGVVAMRPVAKEKALTGSFWGAPQYASFFGPGFWGGGLGEGYLRTDTILVVETLVYSLPQNALVWASQSETTNPSNIGPFIHELTKTVGTEMAKQGLLR
jgi:hypothetical protein